MLSGEEGRSVGGGPGVYGLVRSGHEGPPAGGAGLVGSGDRTRIGGLQVMSLAGCLCPTRICDLGLGVVGVSRGWVERK